jgi:hypothetical protein
MYAEEESTGQGQIILWLELKRITKCPKSVPFGHSDDKRTINKCIEDNADY